MEIRHWLKSLVLDVRWWFNVLIGIGLWIFSYKLLIYLAHHTSYNPTLLNLMIDSTLTVIWYPINRWLLFAKRKTPVGHSARWSFTWWAVTFPLNHILYTMAVLVIDIPYNRAKFVMLGVGILEFFANYWFKSRKSFIARCELEVVTE